MATAKIEINQVRETNNYYYTPKKDLRMLANFLAKFLKGCSFNLIQDEKGNLVIRAIGIMCHESTTFKLKDHETEKVVDVVKSKEFDQNLVYKKFTMKFMVHEQNSVDED
jgi:hypothetical protein